MEKLRLSKSEESIMEFFWKEENPLTTSELNELLENTNTSCKYIYRVIKSLQEKELIEVCGVVKHGKRYAKQFKISITPEQYVIRTLKSQGFSDYNLGKIGIALLKKLILINDAESNKQLVGKLENTVKELKNRAV